MNHPCRIGFALTMAIAALAIFSPGCTPADKTPVTPSAPPPVPPEGFASVEEAMTAVMSGRVPMVDTSKEVPPDVVETKDIEYGHVGDRTLLLDLYMPAAPANPLPVLIFIHGGGWYKGDRADYKYYTVYYAQRGYAVATISYRLRDEAKFPAAIEDAKCAVRWVRANSATYGFEPNSVAVIGGSAGGHIAMMTGYTEGDPAFEGNGGHADRSSAVQAVVNFYGPSDLTTEQARIADEVTRFIGKPYENSPDVYAQASPINHVDSECPPTLIFHGSIDQLVPVAQSEALAQKLQAAGVPCDLHVLDGWPHTMDAAQAVNDYCRHYLDAFLDQHVPRPMQ
jgi:acetyl esterase/lipase